MKRRQPAFALIIALAMLVPLSLCALSAWIIAGRYTDFVRERELCYHDELVLRSAFKSICQLYKTGQFVPPLACCCTFKISEQQLLSYLKKPVQLVVIFDQLPTLLPAQSRLRIQLCDEGGKFKRMLSCVIEKGERVINGINQRCVVVHHVSIGTAL